MCGEVEYRLRDDGAKGGVLLPGAVESGKFYARNMIDMTTFMIYMMDQR
jgi:hypothetical protein